VWCLTDSLKSEESLLASLLSPLARDAARVMIGGSADPGVLCAVGRIYAAHRPIFTINDKCRAPLELIRQFALTKELTCRTLNQDILELDGREQWDQIVLHYTPDFIEAHRRPRFFDNLALSLAPHGTLICATMTGTKVRADRRHDLETAFLTYSRRALREFGLTFDAPGSQMEQELRGHAIGLTTRRLNLPTTDDLRTLLCGVGFEVLSENTTLRRQRFFQDADVIDSSSIIVARRA